MEYWPPPAKVPRPLKSVIPQVLKFLNPPVIKLFTPSLWLEMAASTVFTHGCFQQAYVHISEAIIID